MKHTILLLVLIFTFIPIAFAQQNLPVVKANSAFVNVKDGEVLFNEEWVIGEGTALKPEVYVPLKSDKNKQITFITDVDSITFDTKPNGKYTFIIEYKNQKVFTEIDRSEKLTPTLRKGIRFSRNCTNCVDKPNLIPFRINPKDNGIRIQGKINDSENLDLVFDTGAKLVYVNHSQNNNKVKLLLAGTINDVGGDGLTKLQTSAANKLFIGEMSWKELDVVALDFGDADAIVGWNVFESNPIEIDYDKRIMTIHDSPETISKDYTKYKMEIYNGSPFIQATLIIGNAEITDWFLFDSGFNGSLHLSNRLVVKNNLNGKMRKIGKGITTGSGGGEKGIDVVLLPKIRIGKYEIENIQTGANVAQPDSIPHDDILGNELLKGFNVVLDFKNHDIYLRPNSLFKNSLKK